MLRTVRTIVGGAVALVCLASTLVVAQGQSMTCMQGDGKGNCTAAARTDGKVLVVFGPHVDKGAVVTCEDRGYMVYCVAQ